jgi:hypothetical protein
MIFLLFKVLCYWTTLLYPKHVQFAPLTLSAKYWGPNLWALLNKGLITSWEVLH